MRFCLAFNGQGNQEVELFVRFISSSIEFRELINVTNAIIGEDILKIIENQELLDNAKYGSLSTFFINHCVYLLMIEKYKLYPSVAIGHSLGHYNALVASGSVSYENALKIVKRRAELVEELVEQSVGTGMIGISGTNIDIGEISKLCNELSDEKRFVGISIINTQQNIVLSFYNYHVEEIIDYFADYHIAVLRVPAPYHSKAMLEVVPAFIDELLGVEFSNPTIPVISNVTGKPLNKRQIKNDLIQHLIAPINMYKCVLYSSKMDVSIMLEASLSRVLSKIVSKNHILKAYNIMQDMDKFLEVVEDKECEYDVCLKMLGQLMSIPNIENFISAEELRVFYDELRMHRNVSGEEFKGNPLLYKRYQTIMTMNSRYIDFNNQIITVSY